VHRRGSTEGTSDHYQRNSVWHQPQDYRDQRSQSTGRDWNQQSDRNWNQSSNMRNQDQNRWQEQNRWNQDFRSQDQNRWPQDNRQHMGNYGNHSQDRDWNMHRSGDRSQFENRDRNQSWNRWNEGQRHDQGDWRAHSDRDWQSSQRGYSSDYGHQNPSNQGRGYDENRYQYRRNDMDHDRNDQDEGFFDRMGNKIRDAWNRFTEEEREDQDRANRYDDRYSNYRNNDMRRSSRRDSDTDGPPYSWGSSSSEDYRW